MSLKKDLEKYLISKFIISLSLISYSKAQDSDTIYISDFIGKSRRLYINEGCVIILNNFDTVKLKATNQSSKLPLRGSRVGFYHHPRVQTLRIIKSKDETLRLDIFSAKSMLKIRQVHDTTLLFGTKDRSVPKMYINILKFWVGFDGYDMRMTNAEFAWKNNYQKPRVRRRLDASVVYEYRYPERSLTPIRKHR